MFFAVFTSNAVFTTPLLPLVVDIFALFQCALAAVPGYFPADPLHHSVARVVFFSDIHQGRLHWIFFQAIPAVTESPFYGVSPLYVSRLCPTDTGWWAVTVTITTWLVFFCVRMVCVSVCHGVSVLCSFFRQA